MSRQSKGARLWLEPERKKNGKLRKRATWVIRDGSRKIGTGCAASEREGAERKLAEYIASKYQADRSTGRSAAKILIVDVLNIYNADVVGKHRRPVETGQRLLKIAEFAQSDRLDKVTGNWCRDYVKWRTRQAWKSCKGDEPRFVSEAAARRELEDLRAAINHHRKEGLCTEVVSVVLPDKSMGREVWLTRAEAARLIRSAWRAKQIMRDVTEREVGKHIARFILVGLYTGTRHAAICNAAFQEAIGRGYIDLERGVFYRRAKGARETKKRQTPVRLPDRLLAHLRRWHRLGIATHAVVEWNGKPVRSVRKGFAAAVRAAGLPTTGLEKITPHVLRHTAATWATQNGVDLWHAAGVLGMTVEMLQTRYGHHHPDFQREAVNKLAASGRGLGRQNGDRLTVNKSG